MSISGPDRRTHQQGPVTLRGQMVPETTTDEHLLEAGDGAWVHSDPWRVLRIQSEFVEGFGALAELGPAISIFGSARLREDHPDYECARRIGAGIAERGFAVITGGGPGIMEAGKRGAAETGGGGEVHGVHVCSLLGLVVSVRRPAATGDYEAWRPE